MTTWRNWAGTVTATPAGFARPRDLEGIVDAVRAAGRTGATVRPLGSGHSFSPAAVADGIALDLRSYTGVVHATGEEVTVRAGTRLRELNAELDRLGLAMPNLGDIDAQTVAGAISTGTHGTGARLGGLATQVTALELVLADGSVVRCSADELPDLLRAASVGLGALGVISTVTLRCVPAFTLQADEHPMPFAEVVDRLDEFADDNDHFEFYFFPHADTTLVKRNNRLPATEATQPLHPVRRFVEYQLVENTVLGLMCRLGRAVPGLVKPLNRVAGGMLSTRRYSDRSHQVFVSSRQVRFVETEWAVPREAIRDVLTELRAAVPHLEHPVIFPVEVRFSAGDDLWLSPAHGRDTAYVAVHQYVGMPYRHWFDTVRRICGGIGGRPHWGKMHDLGANELRERYPRFEDFVSLREKLDPEERFRSPYTDQVLGTGTSTD
ncbi:D-arabinono-1,4-lactone oxidase [Longimycelium tulufanense]|uniref:D-arabinono-1,4-lactone oxidase n=1 Tax=Longimycelium tulufanense TaxID=907463 RepID=UPI00166C5A27|nr:D-arabinono-1,4-lactone oxidase [Longimycelium tulufanense]